MKYSRGDGVPVNLAKGAEWFTKAAMQGDPDAQLNLGMMYERGDGVTRNLRTAAEWYGKAADQGHVYAQYNLATMYHAGEGVEKECFKGDRSVHPGG